MLDRTSNASSPTRQADARPLVTNGRLLRRLLHGKSAGARAYVAARLATGDWQITRLLPAQAARLTQVSTTRVGRALGHPPRRRSDRDIDRLIADIGAGRVLTALDRLTSPASNDDAATMQAAE